MKDYWEDKNKTKRSCLLGCLTPILIIVLLVVGGFSYYYYNTIVRGTLIGESTSPNGEHTISVYINGRSLFTQGYSVRTDDEDVFRMTTEMRSNEIYEPLIEWFNNEEACIWFPQTYKSHNVFYTAPNNFDAYSKRCE